MTLADLEADVRAGLPGLDTAVAFGELTVQVPADRILDVLRRLRDELDFDYLVDLSGVHWPGGDHMIDPQLSTTGWPEHRVLGGRGVIEVTYHLLSTERNVRVRLVVAVPDTAPEVPSATGVYPTANYHEREVYDFFGVLFPGHPRLERIFMPDDWVGHPQRKDYPLGGVDTQYQGGQAVPPPDERVWSREVAR